MRIIRLLPLFWSFNGDYAEFESATNGQEFLDGIENDVSLDDDEAF